MDPVQSDTKPRGDPAGDKDGQRSPGGARRARLRRKAGGTGWLLVRVFGGGRRGGWIHGYESKGEIGWFYSSGLLLEGKKLNDRTRQVSLLGGKKTPHPWSKAALGWGRKGTLPALVSSGPSRHLQTLRSEQPAPFTLHSDQGVGEPLGQYVRPSHTRTRTHTHNK